MQKFTVLLSLVANICLAYSSECPFNGRIFSSNDVTHVRAKPEFPAVRDCKAWQDLGLKKSGIYPIKPDFVDEAFQVYCDMETDGGGWTVFQRRMDGTVDFQRTWFEYELGFGNLGREFWLGNSKIHGMTSEESQELRIELSDFANAKRYAKYSTFSIGDSDSKYTLNVGGYSGTAGDSLAPKHNGRKFSTKDQDNDVWSGNCAVTYTGAWWYKNCHGSNLNGQYLINSKDYKGIQWHDTWKKDTLKFTEMKFRQK